MSWSAITSAAPAAGSVRVTMRPRRLHARLQRLGIGARRAQPGEIAAQDQRRPGDHRRRGEEREDRRQQPEQRQEGEHRQGRRR